MESVPGEEEKQGAESGAVAAEIPDNEENIDFQSPFRRRKVLSRATNTISAASKLLRQKIPCSGHLMTPRRLWLQSVPTQDCDMVMTFPSGASDVTLMWLLQRLRSSTPGLVVHVRHHASTDRYGFYLTASPSLLLKAAEELHLAKKVKGAYGGGQKEFVQHESHIFEGIEEQGSFFTSQERQWLVLNLLQMLRATSGDEVAGLRLIEGQAIVPKCISAGIISEVFPLHDTESLKRLQKSWVRAIFKRQPLDQICEYFGVKIAMYFAWLGHYNTALIVPAIVGFLFWVFICGGNQAKEDIGFVIFSLFNVIWATVYLETWKRYSAELAYRWGTLDQRDELLVEPRPLFTGTLEKSPVTGRLEPHYPAWKRHVFRYLISIPIIALCLAVVFVVMFLILQLQEWWDGKLLAKGYPFCLSYIPKILLACVITLMDDCYYKVALWLNDCENYRLETKYENHLIVKVALFQFVNSFLSLFYIAFYLQDQEKLKEQLAALLIARQVIGNIKECALPYLLEQFRLAKLSFELFGALSPSEENKKEVREPGSSNSKESKASTDAEDAEVADEKADSETKDGDRKTRNLSQAELEGTLLKYDGTFEDHLEMFIQFGYVVLFSSAFPMAGLCAMLNNLIEIRTDAFKLCFIFQRPFGQRVSNIGTWQDAMEVMGIIAVLVNCALIGLSGQVHRMFPEMSTTQTILLIVILEHIMLSLRFIISYAIPDLPSWVATEMAKAEFARREACRRASSTASPTHDLTGDSGLVIGRFVVSPASEEDEQEEAPKKEITPEAKIDDEIFLAKPTLPQSISTNQMLDEKAKSKPETPSPGRSHTDSSESDHEKSDKSSPRSGVTKSREWLSDEKRRDPFPPLSSQILNHHLTIGPHGGIDWVKRFGLDTAATRKSGNTIQLDTRGRSANSESSEETASIRHSTDCILAKDTAASDTDLLRSAPPWMQPRSKFRFSPEKDGTKPPGPAEQTLGPEVRRPSAPASTLEKVNGRDELLQPRLEAPRASLDPSNAALVPMSVKSAPPPPRPSTSEVVEASGSKLTAAEELAAKKSRVKSSLLKRARSVAIFSLKLKERRAKEAMKEQEKVSSPPKASQQWTGRNPDRVEGELSCIPIEKLISVDDVANELMRKRTNT
ncbi:anoctamin-8 isoform X1 [Neocloeon triangulifer]|uniref:anoctamin-8 isoform X1 n=1 Tax=Neocloeon triangulifer TaxID=2078957 RepID=UPI00286ECD95|nr:anoctamin-8 isoform X1 [Neocloeon triangulifer]